MITSLRRCVRANHARSNTFPGSRTTGLAQLHSSPVQLARKDAQDKDSLKPEPNEYSKSGSDDEAARIEATAFSPRSTRPEEEQADAAKATGSESQNPLDVSPANRDVSQPRDPKDGGHDGSSAQSGQGPSERERTSGGGTPNKAGGGKSG